MTYPARVLQSIQRSMFVRERPAVGARMLLFVHGLGESGLCFEHLLEREELSGHHVLVPDLPGYGRSLWPLRPLPLEHQVEHLAGWLRERGAASRRLILVGHSMGGVLGVLFAERHPELVEILVNVDGNLSPADCMFSGRAAEHSLEDFLAGGFDRLRETVYRQGARDAAHRGYYAGMRLCDPRQFHLNSRELVEISAGESLARRMSVFAGHAHYIAGVPGGASERSRQLLDESKVKWTAVEPSGHWPFVDQPDRFLQVLMEVVQ